MNSKNNVMIFGGGGYAQIQVYFSLKHSVRFHPIMGSSYPNHSQFISNDALTDLPFTSDENFVEGINKAIDEHNIKFIIPAHDTVALTLMEKAEQLHAIVVCSPLETARICRYKSLTYQALEGTDIIPKIYTYDAPVFPLFAKDDIGQGGRNAILVRNQQLLDELKKQPIDYVLCEYLPGDEITVDCFTDRHGVLRFAQPRTRSRLLNGISAHSETIALTDEIKHIIDTISKRIKFRGYWFAQCKKDDHARYKLMEVSTRFAGTFDLSKSLDVNLPLLALCDFSGIDINITPNRYMIQSDKTYIDRYKMDYHYERVYLDFDDTLVFQRSKYNTEAMRFVYQCFNKGIEIVLLTKHAYDIHQTMRTIHLSEGLFSDIVSVPVGKMKYEYINMEKPSIFIDNAYAEREAVKAHMDMPTFDVSNFDCLIDWADA